MAQAARRPSIWLSVDSPACSSRSMSGSSLASARAAPAGKATTVATRMTAGIVPLAPSQANTGSSGMPSANGSQDTGVPFSRRS